MIIPVFLASSYKQFVVAAHYSARSTAKLGTQSNVAPTPLPIHWRKFTFSIPIPAVPLKAFRAAIKATSSPMLCRAVMLRTFRHCLMRGTTSQQEM